MTVRFVRRLALLHVSAEQLERLLRLPDDVTIRGFTLDHVRSAATFVIESDRFEPVAECTEPPSLIGKVETEMGDDRVATQRVTWAGLEGVEVVTRFGSDTYRRRNDPVRARQFLGDNEGEVQALCPEFHALDEQDRENSGDPDATAQMLQAPHSHWVLVHDGDWIVEHRDGGWVRMTDEEFTAEYEPATP